MLSIAFRQSNTKSHTYTHSHMLIHSWTCKNTTHILIDTCKIHIQHTPYSHIHSCIPTGTDTQNNHTHVYTLTQTYIHFPTQNSHTYTQSHNNNIHRSYTFICLPYTHWMEMMEKAFSWVDKLKQGNAHSSEARIGQEHLKSQSFNASL